MFILQGAPPKLPRLGLTGRGALRDDERGPRQDVWKRDRGAHHTRQSIALGVCTVRAGVGQVLARAHARRAHLFS